jgi:geranylgeranyl diphosphate synthase type I
MDFTNEFDKFKDVFEPKLKAFLYDKVNINGQVNPTGKALLDEVTKASLNSGKRLRPILAYHGFGMVADVATRVGDLHNLGISLELFHTFCLIHDDFIDKSPLRRSQKTIHEIYKSEFGKTMDDGLSAHLGSSAAVLGGDLAFVLAEMAFSKLHKTTPEFIDIFRQMQLEVCLGQADDTFGTGIADLQDLSENQVLNMLDFKSGRYSIEKPLLLGATLAGVNSTQKSILSQFGVRLGIVFQLVDDILGIFGDNLITGKSNTSDLAEGKRTLIVLRTFNKALPEQKNRIKTMLGNPTISPLDFEWFKNLVITSGVLSGIQDFCNNEIVDLKELIENNFDQSESRDFIIGLADYIVTRKK